MTEEHEKTRGVLGELSAFAVLAFVALLVALIIVPGFAGLVVSRLCGATPQQSVVCGFLVSVVCTWQLFRQR